MPDGPMDDALLNKISIPLQVIPTGPVTPAVKRDIALGFARGEIVAFLDDDAYPSRYWLKQAIIDFNDQAIAAVGGPAVTPGDDSLRQKASGAIYQSLLVSGGYYYRYIPSRAKFEVDDLPSCNLLVRKQVMLEIGGFNTKFWPGEDTKLCLDITKNLKKKIIYDPKVLVYHHRRRAFLPHLKQVANYALHRGYFVKRYPETSLKLPYFIPSIFLISLALGLGISLVVSPFAVLFFLGLLYYLFLVFIFSVFNGLKEASNSWKWYKRGVLILDIFIGIILTHLCYGYFFIRGFSSKKLSEENK